MQKLLIAFLFIVFSLLNACGQKQSDNNSKDKSQDKSITQLQIPKGWKLADLDSFSFLLPESTENKKARGIDSAVWRFENEEMTLSIESGIYTNDFQDLEESYEVEEEQVMIDGKNVKFFIWDKNKNNSGTYEVNKDGSIKPHEIFEKHFSIGIYFSEGFFRHEGTHFVITTKTLEEQETAKKVLQSIKFKK